MLKVESSSVSIRDWLTESGRAANFLNHLDWINLLEKLFQNGREENLLNCLKESSKPSEL